MKRIRQPQTILLAAALARQVQAQPPFRGISFPELVAPRAPYHARTYDPANPAETCYDILWASDADDSGTLTNYEYLTFLGVLSEGDFAEENYADIPFVLKVNFVYLSCLCRFRPGNELTGSNCCEGPEGGIDVTGADPEKLIILPADEDYLNTVCSETQSAVEYARIEEGITTASPTLSPVTAGPTGSPTDGPTKSPSPGPTLSPAEIPTTLAPTGPPTLSPSNEPTKSPTPGPTLSPAETPTTLAPTGLPTFFPSAGPSKSPTLQPITSSPTDSPSVKPVTASPTVSPSAKPVTASPTVSPSANPVTDSPTKSPTLNPVTESPSANPTPAPVTDSPTAEPTTLPPSTSPNTTPTTNAPSGTPTAEPTREPTTQAPSAAPTTKAPIVGTGAPTLTPTTESPSVSPTTKAPIIGTASPTVLPTTKAPIVGTGAPTVAPIPAPTVKPTFVQVPTVPTASPTTGTQYPSVSSQPSKITGSLPVPTDPQTIPPWYTPETPSVTPPNPPTLDTPTEAAPTAPLPPGGVEGPTDRDVPTDESETISGGSMVVIIVSSMFVLAGVAYLFAARRKQPDKDPSLEEVANRDFDGQDDLEAGISRREIGPEEDVNRSKPDRPHGSSGGNSSLNDSVLSSSRSLRKSVESDAAVYEGDRYDSQAPKPPPPPEVEAIDGVPSCDSYDAVGVPEYTIPQTQPRSPSSVPVITGVPLSPSRREKGSDSSSAGESGWSSSAGMSSLNTASFDAGTDDGLLPGSPERLLAVAATLGAAEGARHQAGSVQRDAKPTWLPVDVDSENSGSAGSYDFNKPDHMNPLNIHSGLSPTSKQSPSPRRQSNSKVVSREDLNAAIEAGDWAMVGATAALLADSNFTSDRSLSGSITSKDSAKSSLLSTSSQDSGNRTRELDRMVETGDWEGVVLAAAQFQGNASEIEDSTVGSHYDSSVTDGESPRRMLETRREVELLVRRVVPDEVDNIDEMMLQFDGREEELIETLRTMQERSVAQRARAAVQKTAKLEARAKASLAGAEGSQSFAAAASRSALGPSGHSLSGSSADPSFYGSATESSGAGQGYHSASSSVSDNVSELGMTSEDPDTDTRNSVSVSSKTHQSSLELAIEKGDWRAVGEAAAMMGEGSAGIIPDGSQSGEAGDESVSSATSSALTESMGKQERVYYLDALIAKGDWSGIVAAAGKYQAKDDHGSLDGKPSEEEREALAQASMWQNIANQSRQDGSADAQGAVDAADWAISRSLEQKMRGNDSAGSNDLDSKKPRIADDESV